MSVPSLESASSDETLTSARTRFALARALASTGDDPERAHDLAMSARADLPDLDGPAKDLRTAIDAWLETR